MKKHHYIDCGKRLKEIKIKKEGGIMRDLNKVLITGIITNDVEVKYTPDGTQIVNLRVAIHRKYKNKKDEIKEETTFITVVAWKKLAENCAKYLKKGRKVFVEGELRTRDFIDKNQQKRTTIEVRADIIEFLDKIEKKEVPNES